MFAVQNEGRNESAEMVAILDIVVASDLQRFVAIGESVWSRQLECKVSKVVVATCVNTHTDKTGALHCDYYVGDRLIFSEYNHGGNRIRVSYDLVGRQEGRCTDYADGRRISKIEDGEDTYCIRRDRFGVSICKADGFGCWKPVLNAEKCNEIQTMESMIFTPPHDLGLVA